MKAVMIMDRPIKLSKEEQVLVVATTVNVPPERCLAVDCRQGFNDPGKQTSGHIGSHPHILNAFVCNSKFAAWLNMFLDDLLVVTERDRLQLVTEPFGSSFYTIGCWCNKGPS